jgi:hypothetical protein
MVRHTYLGPRCRVSPQPPSIGTGYSLDCRKCPSCRPHWPQQIPQLNRVAAANHTQRTMHFYPSSFPKRAAVSLGSLRFTCTKSSPVSVSYHVSPPYRRTCWNWHFSNTWSACLSPPTEYELLFMLRVSQGLEAASDLVDQCAEMAVSALR